MELQLQWYPQTIWFSWWIHIWEPYPHSHPCPVYELFAHQYSPAPIFSNDMTYGSLWTYGAPVFSTLSNLENTVVLRVKRFIYLSIVIHPSSLINFTRAMSQTHLQKSSVDNVEFLTRFTWHDSRITQTESISSLADSSSRCGKPRLGWRWFLPVSCSPPARCQLVF